MFVVCPLEREHGQAEVFEGLEAPHPQEIFLQRADEALRHAVTVGRSHKARGTLNPEERDLLLEIGGQGVRPVVVTQPQPAGGAVADPAEAVADTLAEGRPGQGRDGGDGDVVTKNQGGSPGAPATPVENDVVYADLERGIDVLLDVLRRQL